MSERTFRRWYQRHEEEGLEGLNDRRLGQPSPKRVPEGWARRVERRAARRVVVGDQPRLPGTVNPAAAVVEK